MLRSTHQGPSPRPEPVTTAGLVARARNGDTDAWDALVCLYDSFLRRVTRQYRLSKEDAVDVVQTTWLRCVEHLNDIREPQRLGAWLATTCRRECLRVLRQASRQVPIDPLGGDGAHPPDRGTRAVAELTADTRDAPETVALRIADAVALRGAMRELTERQRTVLVALSGADALGRGYADVAAELEMPVGSLGPTRQRALVQLRRRLAASQVA